MTAPSIHFVCTDWRHIDEMLTAGKRVYGEFKNLAVWTKTNAGMGSFYRSQHELIFVWKNGRGKHINNIDLGRYGRNRSNVWTYAGVNSFLLPSAQALLGPGCRGDCEASAWAACSRPAREYQGARRPDLIGGATCDLERHQQVLGEAASRLLWRHFERRPVVGDRSGLADPERTTARRSDRWRQKPLCATRLHRALLA